jgi:hypothetical protein
MDRVKNILEASAELRSLHDRVKETARLRDRNPQARDRWGVACREFHARFPALFYPGGDDALLSLRTCDPAAIQAAVDFIAADPQHFRSGYTKEYVWGRLSHCSLLPADIERLSNAALGYLQRRVDRSFWSMCRAMSRLASSEFWNKVEALAASGAEPVSTRASYLLVFKQGAAAGGQLRRKISQEVWLERYRQRKNRSLE